MRIAFVSEHASPLAALGGVDAGGQNVHVAELAASLAALGHQVTVFTRRDDPALPEIVTVPAGYRVVHLTAGPIESVPKDELWPHMPEFAVGLAAALTAEPTDLVHAHFWMSAWAAHRVAASLDIPVVITFHALGSVKRRHQGSADTSPAGRTAVETSLLTSVERVIATSSDEVAELHRLQPGHVPTTIVPCGVDRVLFTPDGPALDGRAQRHRIVALGRLVPRKGYDTVVTALAGVPDTELVIAGGTRGPEPERARLQRLAAEAGVADRVQFLPQVPHTTVPALLRSADVVVTTPWYEPFGIVPVEAMACGRPVVGSAVGGLLDTIVPDRTGVLVPPRDPDALAHALRSLLERPEECERLGANGVRRVAQHYTWPRVAASTVEAYRMVLGTAPEAAPVAVGGRS